MSPPKPDPDASARDPEHKSSGPEVRSAVRFPLELPAVLWTEAGEVTAVTRNISANGVLFELESPLQPGTQLRFSVRMPRELINSTNEVLVHCVGRVIRCSLSQDHYLAAATIDEYRFGEQ